MFQLLLLIYFLASQRLGTVPTNMHDTILSPITQSISWFKINAVLFHQFLLRTQQNYYTLNNNTYLSHKACRSQYSHQFKPLMVINVSEPSSGARKLRFPFGICIKAYKTDCICCDECDQWIHRIYSGMFSIEFSRLN